MALSFGVFSKSEKIIVLIGVNTEIYFLSAGRVFPYFLFEVYKKRNGLFQDATHRFFQMNFTDLIIEEKKESQAIKSFNFSSIDVKGLEK